MCVKSLEAAIGTGHKETHTHWTPAAKKALVRPTIPSAVTLLLDSGYNLGQKRSEVRWEVNPHINPFGTPGMFHLSTTSLTLRHRSSMSAAVRRKSWRGGLSHTLSTSLTLSPSSLMSSSTLSCSPPP